MMRETDVDQLLADLGHSSAASRARMRSPRPCALPLRPAKAHGRQDGPARRRSSVGLLRTLALALLRSTRARVEFRA